MGSAAMCSSQGAVGSGGWTSDFPRRDFFSGKRDLSLSKAAFTIRRLSVITIRAEARTSSQATTDVGGGLPNACFEQPWDMSLTISRPVNRESPCNVERWVEESVHEIVKNIQEAPFLQYVFDSKTRCERSQRHRLTCETSWPSVRASLSAADPDGVILVQKLGAGCATSCCLAEASGAADDLVCPLHPAELGAETNVWGVLVQARGGLPASSACYLLKTTRVASAAGACTRYCLTRATCFGPSHVEQLENAWLL